MLFSWERSVQLTMLLCTSYFFACTMQVCFAWNRFVAENLTIVPRMLGVHVNFKIRFLQWSAVQLCGEMALGKGGGERQVYNRWSSEIQGTALGKCLRAWSCICPWCVAQSRHAFVGGTVSTWARWRIPVNKRQKKRQKCRSSTHCSWGTCRSDSRFPQLVV